MLCYTMLPCACLFHVYCIGHLCCKYNDASIVIDIEMDNFEMNSYICPEYSGITHFKHYHEIIAIDINNIQSSDTLIKHITFLL